MPHICLLEFPVNQSAQGEHGRSGLRRLEGFYEVGGIREAIVQRQEQRPTKGGRLHIVALNLGLSLMSHLINGPFRSGAVRP